MTAAQKVVIGVVGLVLVGLVAVIFSGTSAPTGGSSFVERFPIHFAGGLYGGDAKQLTIDEDGDLTTSGVLTLSGGSLDLTGTGTTTIDTKSTSTTRGFCHEFTATSSATVLNLTFAASTTAVSAAGVTPVIEYGSCL